MSLRNHSRRAHRGGDRAGAAAPLCALPARPVDGAHCASRCAQCVERCAGLCFAAGSAVLARRRAPLRALPAERRGSRAGRGQLTRRSRTLPWAACRADSRSRRMAAPVRHQHLGRHAERDRHAARWPWWRPGRWARSPRAWWKTARASGCLWPTASAATLPCWMRRPGRKRSACWPGAARVTSRSRPMADAFTPRIFIPIRRGSDRSGNRTAPESEITVIDAARAVVVDRIPLHAMAGVFHVAFSADGRLGVVAEYHPKNLVPLAHLEHGGAFADTLTLFGADVGKPVEVPLDELERYASQPFGWRSRRTSRACTSPAAARRW